MSLLASELFAISQSSKCEGEDSCHWCGAPCKRLWSHNEPAKFPGVKPLECSKRPANSYVCVGCWLFRRPRVTVRFLDGSLVDGKSLKNYSLWITEEGTWGVRKEDSAFLYKLLLQPPVRYCLSLIEEKNFNQIQVAISNDFADIKADSLLSFTINNTVYQYTTYDLEKGLQGASGMEPGVGALLRFLGPCQMFKDEEKKEKGRPTKQEESDGRYSTRVITKGKKP